MTTALVLIDLQNDYFPGGTMELVAAETAIAQATRLLDAFRQRSLPIFHIQHIAKRSGATFFLPGTAGAEIRVSVRPASDERVVTKRFPNGFRETTLQCGLSSLRRSANSRPRKSSMFDTPRRGHAVVSRLANTLTNRRARFHRQ